MRGSRCLFLTLLLSWLLAGAPPAIAEEGSADVDARWIEAHIQAFVLPRLPDRPVRVAVPPVADLLPAGMDPDGIEVEISSDAEEPLRGNVPVRIVLRTGDIVVGQRDVTVEIADAQVGLVARRSIARGDQVSEGDFELFPLESAAHRRHALSDPAEVEGMRARRNVPAGTPVRISWFEAIPLVRRGEPVRMRFENEGLRIEATGVAREDGFVGDLVRVQNTSSRTEVVGRVDPEGVIHVAF